MTIVRSDRKLWFLSGAVVLLLLTVFGTVVTFAPVHAQGDMTAFVSESGFLNLSYPADWSLSVDENGIVTIANSEATIEGMTSGQFQTGDIGVSIVLIPASVIDRLGVSVGSSADALQFILAAPVHRVADPDNTQIGDIGTVELDSGHDASLFSLSTPTLDSKVFAVIPTEGVILYVTVVGSTGEYASAEDLILSILGTIDYSGTADDAYDEVLFYPLPV